MKTKFLALLLIAAAILDAYADTWTDPETGYTWMYRISDNTAEIYNNSFVAISPEPNGVVAIPSVLGGKIVTDIGDSAFKDCRGMTGVTIPNGVLNIGISAFSGCSGLESVAIPSSVSNISYCAFMGCDKLASAIIPSSVTSVGWKAFHDCNDLLYDTSIPGVQMVDGWVVGAMGPIDEEMDLTGARNIGSRAFYNCTSLTSVTIPDNVVAIGDGAFSGCSGLARVVIPNSVSRIGKGAFECCTALMSITLPQCVCDEMSGFSRFFPSSCDAVTNIVVADGVTHIAWRAFHGCSALVSVTIPDSVTGIGDSAFGSCKNLTRVNIADISKWCSISFGSFGDWSTNPFDTPYCLYLDDSIVAELVIPDSVRHLRRYAFYNCVGLESVVISDSVETIEKHAFGNCSGLTRIIIPDSVTSIGDDAFNGCDGLTDVSLPANFTGVWTFGNCTNVVRLVAPCVPHGIGSEKLSSIVIPDGVTNIADSAFYGCSSLTNVIIADSVKRIGNSAFGDCSCLTDVNIPDSVEEIGGHAFAGCSGLTNVTIGVGVTNICDRAFADCSNLKNIFVPDSVESIGVGAFSGCSSLTNMVLPFVGSCRGNESRFGYDGEDLLGWIFGWSSYDGGNEVEQFYDVRQSRTYWIPASLRCVEITDEKEIGTGAFDSCSWLTDIVLPDGLMHIRNDAFYGCTALQSILLPVTLKSIDCNLNVHCPNLEWEVRGGYKLYGGWLFGYTDDAEGEIPDADSIYGLANGALEGCTALTNLVFSENAALKYVGTNAFKGCTELRALTLPPRLEEIGDEAFMGCSYLDNVIVPGSVKRVGARAFKNCTGFTGALIEYGVESLGDEAFYGDWRISEVDIPSSVTNIGVSAFGGDSSIIRVGLRGDVRKVSEIFSNYAILREATVKEGDGAIVDGLFEGCVELADVHFLGNCPELANDGRSIYSGTPETLTTYVATTSTGWDGTKGSHALPQAWPLVGNRRSIAQWDLPTYLVLFDSNGGTLGVQSTYQYSERKFTLPPEPVQTGYKFAGWWTTPVGGLRVTGDTVFIEGVYRTLYAHWTKGRWVFLDPNGGTVENEFVTYIEQTEYGVLPTPVRTGYAFDGWTYNGKTVLATDELLTDEDHVLKADWRKNKYTVTFDANFGDGGGVYELEYDSAIVPPVVVREGYTFVGWSPEVAATVPASNVTYAAQWKLNEYRVSLFVGNGEEGSPLVVTHGAKVGDIALPTRDGYVFGGWYDKPDDGILVDGDTLIVGDMSLYAKWNSIYTVVFDANGGEGVMLDQPFVYGEEQSLSNIVFKATDRRFAGWATEKDGIIEYDDGEVVSNLTETANGVVTLFAAWEVWTDDMQVCDDAFGGDGVVSLDANGNIVVTLTNDVSGTVEIPDNVGTVTIDLNGHNMVGNGGEDGGHGVTALPGPAIRIVVGEGEGVATQLAIVDTSEGEKGQISGGGESAGIEVAEDVATGVRLDVEEGVGVFNGDGTEQEFKPRLVGTGKVTVPKTWKVGQKVTWKATADKGSVFARWEGPLVDSLNLTKNERRNPSLAFAVPEGFATNMVTAVFIPIDDDGLYMLGITQTEFKLKEAVSDVCVTDDSQSYVTASVSGLPTGLKFDAKKMCITGAPTKGGVYWVQIKAKNASGYQWAENVKVTVSGDGKEAKEPKLTRTAYYPLTVICATEGGTVSGTGVYAEGKKVTIKATAAKGYVFAGWHETANSEQGIVNNVDGADYRSPSMSVTVPEMRYVFAKFVTEAEDRNSIELAVNGVEMAAGAGRPPYQTNVWAGVYMEWPVAVETLSLPKVAVAGLPSGLKFTDKPVTSKIGSGKTAVTVTNVPAYTIYGAPTAASKVRRDGGIAPYQVNVTVTTASKAKVVYEIDVTVDALPEWAVGTFDGVAFDDGRDGARPSQEEENAQAARSTNGVVTLTVAANGKISGKLIDADGTWTLSAVSFDGVTGTRDACPYQDPETGSQESEVGSPVFVATVIGKNGKMAITNEVEVSAEEMAGTRDGCPYRGVVNALAARPTGSTGGSPVLEEWAAWQNLWKTEPWKSEAKAFAKAPALDIQVGDGHAGRVTLPDGVNGTITLKFAASGAVAASGKFVTGQDAKGNDVVYSASCTSALVPEADAAGAGRPPYRVFLYFPPKAGKFEGCAAEVSLRWDGMSFTIGE